LCSASKSAAGSSGSVRGEIPEAWRVGLHLADDFKELVRQRTDILNLVQESVVLRPQRGGKDYVGLCPFHDDHNPSMHVYTDRQNFKCWVCEAGGDCFSFVMLRDKVGFREALESLAQRAGLDLPQNYRGAGPAGPDTGTKARMFEIIAWAEREFHEYLLGAAGADRARRYLRERGISADSIATFRLGYHPDEWEWLISRARGKYAIDELEAVKLVQKTKERSNWIDAVMFLDRVIFPIRDVQRRPVAFGARILPDSPRRGGQVHEQPRAPAVSEKQAGLWARRSAQGHRKIRHGRGH